MKNLFSTVAILFMSYHLTHKLGLLTLKKKNGSPSLIGKLLHNHFLPVMAKADVSPIDDGVRNIFNSVDDNHDGFINKDECIKAFQTLLRVTLTDNDIKELFNAADKNKDGLISLIEFNEIAKPENNKISFIGKSKT